MNPGIDQWIAPIILTPQALLTPAMKEVVADVASGGAWINRNLQQVIRTVVDRSTPSEIRDSDSVLEPSSVVMIDIVGVPPPCGLNVSQEVGNKKQSASPGLVRQSQKLDAVVDGKFPNNLDSTSIFSKVIGDKISAGYTRDLYTLCRTNFAADPIQTHTPQLINMGI